MRGSLRRWTRKDGSPGWKATAYIGIVDGKERRVSRNFDRKDAAVKWLADQTRAKTAGTLTVPSQETVGEFFDQWLKDYAAGKAPTTRLRYEEQINLHLRPALGDLRLSQLRPQHIVRLLSQKQEEGLLSSTTIQHLHRTLHRVLEVGVEWGVLPTNPVDRVQAPRRAAFEPVVFDVEMAKLFLAEAKRSSPYYRVYLFASLGLRSGEIAGLQWDRVNLLTGQITINQKLYRLRGEPIMSEPKTRYGRRTFTLPGVFIDELRALKREQDAAKALLGDRYEDYNLVFCQPNGKPHWMNKAVYRGFKQILKNCGLNTRMRLHDLRHSAVSILAALGIDPITISRIIGHHSAAFTLSRYGHLLPGAMDGALARLESSLFSGGSKAEK